MVIHGIAFTVPDFRYWNMVGIKKLTFLITVTHYSIVL